MSAEKKASIFIPEQHIAFSGKNPRKHVENEAFFELVQSIKEKGIIQPIIVQRMKPDGDYTLVAGERRLRAARLNGLKEVPAVVHDELTDDQAFDIMMIENIIRADLTEREEAEAFAQYYKLHQGEDSAINSLAERSGMSPRYIRRRIAVMDLPKKILLAWDKSQIYFGHLEQLLRLKNKTSDLNEAFAWLVDDYKAFGTVESVRDLQKRIDDSATELSGALFGFNGDCRACGKNTDVQKSLFGVPGAETCCLDSACFNKKTQEALVNDWDGIKERLELKTGGWRFGSSLAYELKKPFPPSKKIPADCQECETHVTLFVENGSVLCDRVCIGSAKCFAEKTEVKKKKTKAEVESETEVHETEKKATDKKRSVTHAVESREVFYHEVLPDKFEALDPLDNPVPLQTACYMYFIQMDWEHQQAWRDEHKCIEGKVWERLSGLSIKECAEVLKNMALTLLMSRKIAPQARREVSIALGIDLKTEWKITPEYLQKKTKQEILGVGTKFGLWKNAEVQAYLYETLGKKRNDFAGLKKPDLIKCFTESGFDLSGKVPAEITK